jgi:hypothetical protein
VSLSPQDAGNDANNLDIIGQTFDPGLLADLTRVLLPFLGPYSITTVKRAARGSEDTSELLRHIANHIDETAKREVFMKAAHRIVSDYQLEHGDDGSHVSPHNESALQAQKKSSVDATDTATDNTDTANNPSRPTTPVTPELVQRGEAALAPIIGPLAGVLAARYAARASSSREFFDRLAGHLRTPEERDTFFLSVRTGNGTWNA